MPEPLRILCTGDLHLGRVPADVPRHDVSLNVSYIFNRIVDEAISRKVDAVILTGDVVDQDSGFFEAAHVLKENVLRLIEEQITVIAVAGNHDYNVFPQVHKAVGSEHFRFLGEGGMWEHVDIAKDDAPVARLVGWSFPSRHYMTSPLDGFPDRSSEIPLIAILHSDLDVRDSRYAPVMQDDLSRLPVNLWLLGHQHPPRVIHSGSTTIIYPGSPQPLRAPESGIRGPMLVTVHMDRRIEAETIPLATIRYENRMVDVTDLDELEDLNQRVFEAVQNAQREFKQEQPDLQHTVLTLTLSGRTPLHRLLPDRAAQILDENKHASRDYSIRDIRVATSTVHDLEKYARGNDIPAELARLLIALKDDEPRVEELIRKADSRVQTVKSYKAFQELSARNEESPQVDSRAVLLEQGYLLLDSLLAQSADA